MSQCKIVEDLWPLYLDGELSVESKQFIEEHLRQCASCQKLNRDGLKTGLGELPDSPEIPAGSPEKFLLKLKRRVLQVAVGTVIGGVILTGIVWSYSQSAAERSYERQLQDEKKFFQEQIVALEKVSPPALELLKKVGVSYSLREARTSGDRILISYSLDQEAGSPVEWIIEDDHWFNEDVLLDAQSGSPLPLLQSSSSGTRAGLKKNLEARRAGREESKLILKSKTLFAVMKPDGPGFNYKFSYDGSPKNIDINQKFVFQGVEFSIDSLVLDKKRFIVKYRQLTPVVDVGVYQLQFDFDDRMGNIYSSGPVNEVDVKNPKEFKVEAPISPSKNWILKLRRVNRVIPGIETKVDLTKGV